MKKNMCVICNSKDSLHYVTGFKTFYGKFLLYEPVCSSHISNYIQENALWGYVKTFRYRIAVFAILFSILWTLFAFNIAITSKVLNPIIAIFPVVGIIVIIISLRTYLKYG